MAQTTYSFSDIYMTFSHPSAGVFTMNGEGIGEVDISYINDNSVHDLASDGSVMVSKIKADNATISISMQQTSSFHKWLQNYFNAINIQDPTVWAAATINISSPLGLYEFVNATGVSPQKRPDQPYQQQGQRVTWNFMAANCSIK